MGVDVGPFGGHQLQLGSHLADQDVYRAVAALHGAAPDRGVDLGALDDAVDSLGEQVEELELADGETGALAVGEYLQLARPDLKVGDVEDALLGGRDRHGRSLPDRVRRLVKDSF